MHVELLSFTPNPEQLVAAAAKLCYSKQNISNVMSNLSPKVIHEFIEKLESVGHESPFEHVNFTFGIEGISRTTSHQLVRHRIASYSQQSQRYVNVSENFDYVIPPRIEQDKEAFEVYESFMKLHGEKFELLTSLLLPKEMFNYVSSKPSLFSETTLCMIGIPELKNASVETALTFPIQFYELMKQTEEVEKMVEIIKIAKANALKTIQEDIRYITPNAAATKIIVTMNARSLNNFFKHRDCKRAQWEIRTLAHIMHTLVEEVAPTLFKYSGAGCRYGTCPEGEMTCGKPYKRRF